jgi:FixJ family two-component response regulator
VLQTLTPREREVLSAVAQGMNSRAIGARLEISPRTVEIHRANMMHKIGARNAADAVRLLIEAAANSELGFNNDNWVAPWTDGEEQAERATA